MAGLARLRVVAPPLLCHRLGMLVEQRAYGSAGAAQLLYDYDDEYYDDEEIHGDRRQTGPRLDTVGSVTGRGVQWVVMGEPGAKKHVYAERLSKLLEVPHISMGTLVRQELNPHSFLYKKIANSLNEGKLVSQEIIFALLSKRLEEGYCRGESGFILDGIPRTRIQAEILDQIADIDLVVNFKCTEKDLAKNNIGTGNFPLCQEMKSTTADTGNPWAEKFQFYAEQSKLLKEYYNKQRKLVDFQVTGAPSETWKGLLVALHLQHMNAVGSSQKLTA